jgi:hypothetical protein
MNEVEIIARYLCQVSGEDPDAPMFPTIGFQKERREDRTADDNSPRWKGFTGSAEELWRQLETHRGEWGGDVFPPLLED